MAHTHNKSSVHLTRKVPFAYLETYIKEIQVIDRTPRAIKPFSATRAFQPLVINFDYAPRPTSILFCGRSVQDWEVSLN